MPLPPAWVVNSYYHWSQFKSYVCKLSDKILKLTGLHWRFRGNQFKMPTYMVENRYSGENTEQCWCGVLIPDAVGTTNDRCHTVVEQWRWLPVIIICLNKVPVPILIDISRPKIPHVVATAIASNNRCLWHRDNRQEKAKTSPYIWEHNLYNFTSILYI